MTKQLQLDSKVPWKARYRAASIPWPVLASRNPSRGLVCTNRDGTYQLYAWTVESGELGALTDAPTGVVGGMLSADGEFVYYLQDNGGNEIAMLQHPPGVVSASMFDSGGHILIAWQDGAHPARLVLLDGGDRSTGRDRA
jgi:Tol biopolymer transport system component